MRLAPKLSRRRGKFRLRVLAELNTFVHRPDDVCLGQELVRDELPRSHGNSECDASSSNCGDVDHVLNVADPPLRRWCNQVVHEVNDLRFLWCSFRSNFRIGVVEFVQVRRDQDRATFSGPPS